MQRFPLGRVHELVRKDVVQKLPVLAHTNPGKGREETVGKGKWLPESSPKSKLHVKKWKLIRVQYGLFPLFPENSESQPQLLL